MNELNQWLSALRKASAPNQDKLAACHPGAFRGGRWTCCLQAERPGEGQGRLKAPPFPPLRWREFPFCPGGLCNRGRVT